MEKSGLMSFVSKSLIFNRFSNKNIASGKKNKISSRNHLFSIGSPIKWYEKVKMDVENGKVSKSLIFNRFSNVILKIKGGKKSSQKDVSKSLIFNRFSNIIKIEELPNSGTSLEITYFQ